jgi:Family of unknown function (DUF6459)
MTAARPAQFARVIVETLAGSRPTRQLIPMTTESARSQLGLLATYLTSDRPPRLRRVVASQPSERVVEMTVIVSCGARSRALAMRLEHMPGRAATPGLPARPARWLCTEVETG